MQRGYEYLKGDLKPKVHSAICQIWGKTHKNCVGCPSYKDCKEYVTRIGEYVKLVLQSSS